MAHRLQPSIRGTGYRNLEAGVEVEAMTECCLLALLPWLVQGGSAYSRLRPPISVINEKKDNPKPRYAALDFLAVLLTLTQELPPHILWIRMSQNAGTWGPLGKQGVWSATCTVGEQLAGPQEGNVLRRQQVLATG